MNIVKIATYQSYHLVSYHTFYRMQAHKSKEREEHNLFFLSYINQCYGNPCLPVLRCCLKWSGFASMCNGKIIKLHQAKLAKGDGQEPVQIHARKSE